MIQSLSIKNFKANKEVKIPCKKLNIFKGEPNSGKSNNPTGTRGGLAIHRGAS